MRLLLLKMNNFLKEARELVVKQKCTEKVLVVMGNESVDLDSAISSLTLAYHLGQNKNSHLIPERYRSSIQHVVPVINCKKELLPIKTEVNYWLKKHGIDVENLIANDEIHLAKIDFFVLVDHHVSDDYRQKVIGVLDHRPFDPRSDLNRDCFVNIREVGSCATLIADAIRKDFNKLDTEIGPLLYGPIVLDTINFSKDAGKVRPLDEEMASFIEKSQNSFDVQKRRKTTYDELVEARAHVEFLDSYQLLYKDLKMITSDNGRNRIAIPGVHVFDWVTMPNAEKNLRKFATANYVDVVILMGLIPAGDSIERQLAVINMMNTELFQSVSVLEI